MQRGVPSGYAPFFCALMVGAGENTQAGVFCAHFGALSIKA